MSLYVSLLRMYFLIHAQCLQLTVKGIVDCFTGIEWYTTSIGCRGPTCWIECFEYFTKIDGCNYYEESVGMVKKAIMA